MPSAEHYARAIVAASRATGEWPATIADGSPDSKARHYAFHALLAVFPKADRTAVAAALAAPGKAAYFHRTSLWHVLGDGPHRQEPIEWWDSGVLALTIKAVESAVPRLAPTGTPLSPSCANPLKIGNLPSKGSKGTSTGYRPAPGTYEHELADASAPRTGLDRFAARFGNSPVLDARARERKECRDILAEAAANTLKLQAKLPKD